MAYVDVGVNIKASITDAVVGIRTVRRELKALHREQQVSAARLAYIEKQSKEVTKALQHQSTAVRSLTGDFFALRRVILTFSVRVAITGLTTLVSAMNAAATGAATLAASLANLGGAAAIGGAAGLGALVSGVGLLTIALKGLGDAYTSTGKQHSDALKKLTPTQRAFYSQTKEITEAFRILQGTVQAGVLPGLAAAFKELAPLADDFRQHIWDASLVMGYLVERAGEMARRRAPELNRIFSRNTITMRRFGTATENVVAGMVTVFDKAGPLIGRITRDVVTFSKKVKDIGGSGVTGVMRDLRKSWENWTAIFGAVGKGLFGFWQAIQPVVHKVEDAIEKSMKSFAKWTNNDKNQKKILKFFDDSLPVMSEFVKLIGGLAKLWVEFAEHGNKNAERLFRGLRTDLLPFLKDIFLYLGDKVFPKLMDLGGAFLDFMRAALPGFKSLLSVLGPFTDAIIFVLDKAKELVEWASDFGKVGAAIAALGVSAAIITSWRAFRSAIALTVLSLRAFSGSRGADGLPVPMPARQSWAAIAPGRGIYNFGRNATRSARQMPGRIRDNIVDRNQRLLVASEQPLYRDYMRQYGPRPGWDTASGARATGPRVTGLVPLPTSGVLRVGNNLTSHRSADGRFRGPDGRFAAPPSVIASGQLLSRSGPGSLRTGGDAAKMFKQYEQQMEKSTRKGFLRGFRGSAGSINPLAGMGGGLALTGAMMAGPDLYKNFKNAFADKNSLGLLKTRGRGGPFGGNMPVIDSILGGHKSSDPIRKFGDEVEKMYAKAKKAGDSRALVRLAHQARDLGRLGGDGAGELKAFGTAIENELLGTTGDAFKEFANRGDRSISQVMDGLAVLQNEIGNKLPASSRVYKEAMGRSFTTAAAVIKAQIDAGVISAEKGMKRYRTLLTKGLQEYGLSPKQAKEYANRRATGQSERNELGSVGNARGGFHLGRPGASGRDNIPMMVNGKPVIAAEGEYVGVFNRHQKPLLDTAVAGLGYGSLEDFMGKNNRPHYMAGGGIVGLGKSLQRQGYSVGEHPAFGGVGKHAPNSQHYVGNALDVNADHWPGGETAALNKLASRLIARGWNVLWQVADHFDHLHVDGRGKSLKPFKLGRVKAKGDGASMPLVQPILDKSRKSFTALGRDILGKSFGSSGDLPGGVSGSNQEIARKLLGTFGWDDSQWPALKALGKGESNWDENAINQSSGAFGIGQFLGATKRAYAKFGATSRNPAQQINAMLHYIKDRYGSPQAAYAHWLRQNPHWYYAGGLDAQASASPPPRGSEPPSVGTGPGQINTTPQSKSKKKKDDDDKKKPRFYGKKPAKGQGYSRADFKPKGRKPKRPKLRPKVRKLINGPWKNMELTKIDPLTGERSNMLLGFYNQWGKTADKFALDLEILQGNQGLSEEQAIVTNDAGQDVLNPNGMTVGGKFIPGIGQALAEITDQLFQYRERPFADKRSTNGGILGIYESQETYLKGLKPYVRSGIKERRGRLMKLKKVFEANVDLRKKQAEKLKKMKNKGLSYKEAIRHNNGIIKAWRRYKRDSDLKPGQTREADGEIDRLVDENDWLRTKKPSNKSVGSRGYQELFESYRQRGYENMRITGSSDTRKWDLSSFTPGSAAARMADSLGFFTEIRDFTSSELPTLKSLIGGTKTTITGLENAYKDWSGTQPPKPDTSAQDSVNEMLAEIGRQYLAHQRESDAKGNILKQFAPLVEARKIGAFAHGGPITETGMALVHRGEYVLPSPDGPFRRGMNAPTAASSPVNIELVFKDRAGQLIELVDSRIDKRAATVTSRQQGMQSRLLRAAPGG